MKNKKSSGFFFQSFYFFSIEVKMHFLLFLSYWKANTYSTYCNRGWNVQWSQFFFSVHFSPNFGKFRSYEAWVMSSWHSNASIFEIHRKNEKVYKKGRKKAPCILNILPSPRHDNSSHFLFLARKKMYLFESLFPYHLNLVSLTYVIASSQMYSTKM